jgi:hypothetical protein
MSRRIPFLALVLIIGCLAPDGAGAAPQEPMIERAAPDPARRALVAAWRAEFERQSPTLGQAVAELTRERDRWRGSRGGRCVRAQELLAGIDREPLLAASDYRLVLAVGRALDELESAAGACRDRRYFELDYRLGLAARALAWVEELSRPAVGRGVEPWRR